LPAFAERGLKQGELCIERIYKFEIILFLKQQYLHGTSLVNLLPGWLK
jgi:hypothetical protein